MPPSQALLLRNATFRRLLPCPRLDEFEVKCDGAERRTDSKKRLVSIGRESHHIGSRFVQATQRGLLIGDRLGVLSSTNLLEAHARP